ncbi:hypothetical protein AB4Z24_08110 [Hyphomicrobium sp. 2TAF46]
MSRQRAQRPSVRRGRPDGVPDDPCAPAFDPFDYRLPAPLARRDRRRRDVDADLAGWTVTDDWPEHIPVTEAEVDLFERWFGDVFDELFGTKQ